MLERMTFARRRTKDITVIRVISATNQNLESMVREGTFREDLYYRLKVVPIRVPPLRERREDILPLARHFLDQFNRAFGKSFAAIDPEAERILLTYPWPGNIRELRNLFERIVLLNQASSLQAQHLNAAIAPAARRRGSTPLQTLEGSSIRDSSPTRDRSGGLSRLRGEGDHPAGVRLDPGIRVERRSASDEA